MVQIKHVEIGNFRKLLAVRIDFAPDKTVFVGANNSGKTSAMVALRRFLVDTRSFAINDLSLTHWKPINDIGENWELAFKNDTALPNADLTHLLPFIDVWLQVGPGEMHYVQKIIPTLDWDGELLGVRLRYEPEDAVSLQQEFLTVRAANAHTIAEAAATTENSSEFSVSLWPQSLIDFIDRRMTKLFKVKAHLLDPTKLTEPVQGQATPQSLPVDVEPLDGNPLDGLIQIDEISAQRGFGQMGSSRSTRNGEGDISQESRGGRRLSTQLRSYYDKHLDPYDTPEPSDLHALEALDNARKAFDERLTLSFRDALTELEGLGYPGVTDPKLVISTNIRLQDGLNHASAVQYQVPSVLPLSTNLRLPEDSNGLGYQNLVSMVFALMSYRDSWMRVGKSGNNEDISAAPLHLVLVEEPEAHLHAQVQQVFIKHAYSVLRNHKNLGTSKKLVTQLVVSTHSSHVAHACDFASLRYFRRLPTSPTSPVPIAAVVNLTFVFGDENQTAKFVTRYLKATHCDLFFADGVVLVEGAAERILVPHFVEDRTQFAYLKRCYLSWLEIGGSHAHRLKGLIEELGLTTLIITDLDAENSKSREAENPKRNAQQHARNETLKTWTPKIALVDTLLDLPEEKKSTSYETGYSVRSAYQLPTQVKFKDKTGEALAYTFEDALFYQNVDFFKDRKDSGLAGKFSRCLAEASNLADLATKIRTAVGGGGKAEFALNLLYSDDIDNLEVPAYIEHGLKWLVVQMQRKENDLVSTSAKA